VDAIRYNSPEFTDRWIDTTDLEPPRNTVRTADDTLPDDPRFDIQYINADLNEPLGKNVGKLALTEIVVCEPPEVTYGHDTGIVDTDPCPIVELMNRCCHRRYRTGNVLTATICAVTVVRHHI
jgi:hypothetical protein